MEKLLSEREISVLKYVCQGYSNKEIADILFISPHTAKFYVSEILKKFRVDNRTIAAFIACKNNMFVGNFGTSTNDPQESIDILPNFTLNLS